MWIFYGFVLLIVLGYLVLLWILNSKLFIVNWRQYEKECEQYWKDKSYKTRLGKGSNDEGVDIIAWKGKEKRAIQCKRYGKSKVTGPMVRELIGSAALLKIDNCCIMTTGRLTAQAREHAKRLGVKIIKTT